MKPVLRQSRVPPRFGPRWNPWRAHKIRRTERRVAAMTLSEARAHLEKAFDVEGAKAACRALPANVQFIYLPWIASHGDALFQLINGSEPISAPIPLVQDIAKAGRRHRASASVRRRPDAFLPLCLEVLAELPPHVRGVLFSHDWTPVMRQMAYACKQLGLETVLVPHEGIFARADAYYQDLNNGADYPVCDRVLAWGDLQAQIFISRGYPEDRISVVGAPKFDFALRYQASLSREAFAARFGFESKKPVVLFALQPLDSQYDRQRAKSAQRSAIRVLAAACRRRGWQLLLRGTPNGDDVLGWHKRLLTRMPHVVLDDGQPYRVSATEAIYHSAVVFAVNSTMLFEAALIGRPSTAVPGADPGATWQLAGGPVIDLGEGFDAEVARLIERATPTLPTEDGSSFARALSVGRFDGKAVARVRDALTDPSQRRETLDFGDTSFLFEEHVSEAGKLVPGTLALSDERAPSMPQIAAMLGFHYAIVPTTLHDAARADVFARFSRGASEGQGASETHRRLDDYARALRRPRLVLEDGLIHSPRRADGALSLLIDDKASCFDATQATRLEDRLNAGWTLDAEQQTRCERAMARIVALHPGEAHASDVHGLAQDFALVLDQAVGDQSVSAGLADASAFEAMLEAALAENADRRVVVSRPLAAGSRRTAWHLASVGGRRSDERLRIADEGAHALLRACGRVYTVSSNLGFEALMHGKRVRCFGMPFYAGWGLTHDEVTCPRRVRERTLLEVFHAAYLVHSRYYSPVLERACDLEDVLDYLASKQHRRDLRSNAALP